MESRRENQLELSDVVTLISSNSFNHIRERNSELGRVTYTPVMYIRVDMQDLTSHFTLSMF